jgi:putative transposase
VRTKTPSFIVDIPLLADRRAVAALEKKLEAARHIYNAVLGESLRRLALMRESKAWQSAQALPKTTKKAERQAAFEKVRQDFGFKSGALQKFAEACRDACWTGQHGHLDSHDTQTTSLRAFRAVEAYAFGKRGRPRFKGRNRLNSVEGKANTVIRYKEARADEQGNVVRLVLWGGLTLPLIVKKDDLWLNDALAGAAERVKYVRVVRKMAGASPRWFAQLVMEGVSPRKRGEQPSPEGVVGLDIGPSTIAIVSGHTASLDYFAPKAGEMGGEIRRMQRAMDRSRRATNPDAFNADGTYKKGVKIKVRSRRYRQLAARKARVERRVSAERKREHGELANRVLRAGNTVKTEKVSYRSFQKNFGKSVGRRAPGLFVSTLKRKAASAGARVVEFSTQKTKLSQFSHDTGRCEKKPLSRRWHTFADGSLVQRDLYAAWLARFVENDTLDASRCQAQWATAEPLLRQAASSSPICKRGRHEPTSTRLPARQSGSPVEAEVEKERGLGSVAMAGDAKARAGESPSYTQNPLPSGMGEAQLRMLNSMSASVK